MTAAPRQSAARSRADRLRPDRPSRRSRRRERSTRNRSRNGGTRGGSAVRVRATAMLRRRANARRENARGYGGCARRPETTRSATCRAALGRQVIGHAGAKGGSQGAITGVIFASLLVALHEWYAASEKEARVSCGIFLRGCHAASDGTAIASTQRRSVECLRASSQTLSRRCHNKVGAPSAWRV
jgi:hypothetical protein